MYSRVLISLITLLISAIIPCYGLGNQLPIVDNEIRYTDQELAFISSHGPWPSSPVGDPSNRYSGNVDAIALGQQLFSDPALSRNGTVSCATCHDPENAFVDHKAVATGLDQLDRNTPTVINSAAHRWFGWSGDSDSLWMQNIRPIVSPIEMDGAERPGHLFATQPCYGNAITKLTEISLKQLSDEQLLVLTAKVLAAYIETLNSPQTAFDRYRLGLLNRDKKATAAYPLDAKRGLKIFTGKGNCSICHFGPLFSNREFSDVGIAYFTPTGVDKGRYAGILNVQKSRFNLLGEYSDADDPDVGQQTRLLKKRHDSFGQFRVPGLRGIAQTAPYMHNGSIATLDDVVNHYSGLDMERLHTDGTSILKPLNLSESEAEQLVAFLRTLSF